MNCPSFWGYYRNMPLKNGLNYGFNDNASAADILGLGMGRDGQ